MALVLPAYLIIPICFIIAYIICYHIGLRIWFTIWRKSEIENDKDKEYYNFKRFKDWHSEGVILIRILFTVVLIFTCVFPSMALHQIYKNHSMEATTYQQYLTEYDTLNDILNSTTDVVNSDVYLRVNEYNKEISKFKSQFNNPKWSYNFTGKLNWNELNMIDIKGES